MNQITTATETKELKPARENPWYVLATIHGEQDGEEVDWDLHQKNRDTWNAWVIAGLSPKQLAALKEVQEAPWSEIIQQEYDLDKHIALISEKIPDHQNLRDAVEVSFSENAFEKHLSLARFIFPVRVDFYGSAFSRKVFFDHSIFLGRVSFTGSKFFGKASFGKVEFRKTVHFHGAIFHKPVSLLGARFGRFATFRQSQFFENAKFSDCEFYGDTWFTDAVFSKECVFSKAKFKKFISFECSKFLDYTSFFMTSFESDAEFIEASFKESSFFTKSYFIGYVYFNQCLSHDILSFNESRFEQPASFIAAQFQNRYPDFTRADLHEQSRFTTQLENWPSDIPAAHIEQSRETSATLRHLMSRQGRPEEEHFFFRREMAFTAKQIPLFRGLPYRIFGLFSEFGYSIGRPIYALIGQGIVFAALYMCFFCPAVDTEKGDTLWTAIQQSLGLSVASTMPVFGVHKLFANVKIEEAPNWLVAMTGLQTVIGLALIFLLGLGLRTRFRLR